MHRRKDLLSAIHQLFLPAAKAMGRLFKIPPFEFSGNATVPVRIIDDSQVANKICCSLSSRSEEHTSELQSLMRISYAAFCLKKKRNKMITTTLSITNRQSHDKHT